MSQGQNAPWRLSSSSATWAGDIWANVFKNLEFPDCSEPSETAEASHSSLLKVNISRTKLMGSQQWYYSIWNKKKSRMNDQKWRAVTSVKSHDLFPSLQIWPSLWPWNLLIERVVGSLEGRACNIIENIFLQSFSKEIHGHLPQIPWRKGTIQTFWDLLNTWHW